MALRPLHLECAPSFPLLASLTVCLQTARATPAWLPDSLLCCAAKHCDLLAAAPD